jgi:hypothetical protein
MEGIFFLKERAASNSFGFQTLKKNQLREEVQFICATNATWGWQKKKLCFLFYIKPWSQYGGQFALAQRESTKGSIGWIFCADMCIIVYHRLNPLVKIYYFNLYATCRTWYTSVTWSNPYYVSHTGMDGFLSIGAT